MADSENPDDRADDATPDEKANDQKSKGAKPTGNAEPSDAAADALKAAMEAISGLRDETADAVAATPEAQAEKAAPATNESVDAMFAEAAADAASETQATAPPPAAETNSGEINLPEFTSSAADNGEASGVDLLSRVNLNVRIELGRTKMLVEDVLRLNEGSVVELDKLAGDPVDIYVNDRLVACGEVLVLNDAFSVRINEIVGQHKLAAPVAS